MKKLISICLCLCLLSGCFVENIFSFNNSFNLIKNAEKLEGKDYIELIKNYKVRKKNKNNTIDNVEFDEFLDDIFVEACQQDYMFMHFTVIDYKKYGIEKPELTLGEINYDDEFDNTNLLDQYERLHSFDFNSLSYSQQYDYECLEYSILESLAYSFYDNYNQVFSTKTDLLANLVSNFDEFVFYSKEDVDDYLVLLKDSDRYINDALVFTDKQAKDGIYLSDSSIDYYIDYVDSFVSKVYNNSLIESFNKRINGLSFLTYDEKQDYIKQNKDIIINELIPSFKTVKEELTAYKGSIDISENTLKNINSEFAQITYMIATSNNKTMEDLFEDAKNDFDDYIGLFNSALYSEDGIIGYQNAHYGLIEPLNQDYSSIINFLYQNYLIKYPDLGEINYEASVLDDTSASDSIIAYYVPMPIDNIDQNVIKVNPNNMNKNPVGDYITIAHEGIPGHLYQYYYCALNNEHTFRHALSFVGYQEGYACYGSIEALDFLYLGPKAKDIIFYDNFGGYILESIIDIGVNYFDWTVDDVSIFLEESGYDGSIGESIRDDVIDRYSLLCSYGIGYLNFIELKNYAIKKLGNKFDEIGFNNAILKNGQLPFPILKGAVDEYIEEVLH